MNSRKKRTTTSATIVGASDAHEAPARKNSAAPTLQRFKPESAPVGFTSTTDAERTFYQSAMWRKFRQRHLSATLQKDQVRARNLVKANPRMGIDYTNWMITGKPLCEVSFKAGLIVPAAVLDHIRPIRDGGDRWSYTNLQWLSDTEHNRKSVRDQRNRK